uniref:Small ribosomal subunit protein uS3c n=1 Tax=Chlamydomonas peterfii TaxID=28462 RepID=A0A0S2ICA9_9CHLO|nr:ribosomal protein S3 [Chlamydomonas peterfii]
MGQKVHPLGFRVGITKKHQSQWFARFNKYAYAQSVVEDFMLRKTLMKMFPDLLALPLRGKKTQKSSGGAGQPNQETDVLPKITQIKIERGLIPYEIGIQIHAENCEQIQAAIDNLKGNGTDGGLRFFENLQKTRQYLSKVVSPITAYGEAGQEKIEDGYGQDIAANTSKSQSTVSSLSADATNTVSKKTFIKSLSQKKTERSLNLDKKWTGSAGKRGAASGLDKKFQSTRGYAGAGANFAKADNQKGFRSGKNPKNTKTGKMSLRTNTATPVKRFKKRQSIRNRYFQLLSKGLFIRKNGNQIMRKVSLKGFIKASPEKLKYNSGAVSAGSRFNKKNGLAGQNLTTTSQAKLNIKGARNQAFKPGLLGQRPTTSRLGTSVLIKKLSNKLSKKFATLFINKLNKKFLVSLKAIMKYWHKQNTNTIFANYNKKWTAWQDSMQKKQNLANPQSITKWNKLIDVLEKKSLQKLEYLRKDFMNFGAISKTRSFGYYQLITLLKQVKEFVMRSTKLRLLFGRSTAQKNQNKTTGSQQTLNKAYLAKATTPLTKISGVSLQKSVTTALQENIFNTIQANINNGGSNNKESRKLKLISYLQNRIQTYRTENLFYYLSSMANASKDFKELKRYTKQHSNFLFGFTADAQLSKETTAGGLYTINNKTFLQEKIEKVLTKSNQKVDFDKNLQDAFLDQVENQRKMYKANLALTPKISIQFFSVKQDNLFEKASVVADSVVDALEKRKAFRGVIKKAKEDLMRRSRVKGVKIQVAGRLNGAEIARSEWVRAGRVPLQTLRANIDYSYRTASTIYGIIGVKVWIFKGYY